MRALRIAGNAVLTAAAAVGIACALAWGATVAGWIQPFVVVSGSMEPEIRTGDLLIATPTPVDELAVGQVASIPSRVTENVVTHRIVEVTPTGSGSAEIRMQGDANQSIDGETYVVAGEVWQPRWTIAGGGYAVATISRPGVAVPLLVAVVALIGLTLVPSTARPAATSPEYERSTT